MRSTTGDAPPRRVHYWAAGLALAVGLGIGLGGCGDGREASRPPGTATLPPSGPPVTGEVPEAVLAAILEDAARRTGADPATAKIVRAEAVTWSDGSLGCPEPGMFYIQILIDGYWVVVELGGQTLDYRVGAHGAFRLCEQPAP